MFRTYAVSYDRFSAFRRVVRKSGWRITSVARTPGLGEAIVTVER